MKTVLLKQKISSILDCLLFSTLFLFTIFNTSLLFSYAQIQDTSESFNLAETGSNPSPSPTPSVSPTNVPSLKDTPMLNETPFLVERFKITDIAIVGTDRKDSILIAMYIKARDTVTTAQIREDLRRISGLGYFFDVNATREPYEDGYRLIIQVIENPVLTKVDIVSDITVFKKEQIQEIFTDMLNKTVNYNDMETAKEKIKKLYSDLGYVLVDTDFRLSVQGVLTFYIKEGVIEDIRVVGNKETRTFVILREITQKPEDLFNINIMKSDLRRVFNLNYFENVNLDFNVGEKDPQKVIVIIKVEEKSTGNVNLGAGYNTRDGIVGIFTISKDNLFGRAERLGFDLTIGGKSWYGKVDWYDPWLFKDRTSLGTSLYKERTPQFYANFIEDRTGVRISSGRPLFGDPITSPWRGAISLRAERVTALDLEGKLNSDLAVSKSIDASDNIFGAGLSLSFDTRDIVFDPHSGWFNSISVEPIWGDARYIKLSTSINTYIPVADFLTLAIGSRFGMINGLTPKYEKYYSGGFNTIRGWQEAGYLFGDTMLINSIELRFPIYEMISGAAFFDFGQFWENGMPVDAKYETDNPTTLYPYLFRYGFGLGVRLNTPLGPIRFDYGFNDITDFSKGQIHFSIGQKF